MLATVELNLKPARLITLKSHIDDRGWFTETYRKSWYESLENTEFIFEFNTLSKIQKTLRGLHCQNDLMSQSKLVTVLQGRIFDVIVDARLNSPTYGQYQTFILSDNLIQTLYVPKGFYHGFLTLETNTLVNYKLDNYHLEEAETGLMYNDSTLNIPWPCDPLVISKRDQNHPSWGNCFKFKE